jgi:pimeloyl-ACP methyl ester carboxylesterase
MRIEFRPDPDLYPFQSRWFDGSAGRMHYVDEGSGTPILFCHGNPTWSFLYRGVVVSVGLRETPHRPLTFSLFAWNFSGPEEGMRESGDGNGKTPIGYPTRSMAPSTTRARDR